MSAISVRVKENLELEKSDLIATGVKSVNSGMPTDEELYLINFKITGSDNSVLENSLNVIVNKNMDAQYDFLMGLDILEFAIFNYDGHHRLNSLTFPPTVK